MCASQHFVRHIRQHLGGIFLDRSERPIAAAVQGLLPSDQVALVQGKQKRAGIRHTANRLDILDVKSARKHGQLRKDFFGASGKQVKRIMPTQAAASSVQEGYRRPGAKSRRLRYSQPESAHPSRQPWNERAP